MTEKPSFEQYQSDTIRELGFADKIAAERAYEFNLRAAHQSVAGSPVINGVVIALNDMGKCYAPGRPELLFYPPHVPDLEFQKKPFESVILKLYRKNVLFNKFYPSPPRGGALHPADFYEQIDDLIRTRLVCKYMDGPSFVCKELKSYCDGSGIDSVHRELSTEFGYYAWHFYLKVPVELMFSASVEQKYMWVEIQISTQLSEVITALTHGLYETRRLNGVNPQDREWKWDAGSQRFRSAYLGHGLHLLEGIIQNLKDDLLKQSEQERAVPGELDSTTLDCNAEPTTQAQPSPVAQED